MHPNPELEFTTDDNHIYIFIFSIGVAQLDIANKNIAAGIVFYCVNLEIGKISEIMGSSDSLFHRFMEDHLISKDDNLQNIHRNRV